MTRGPVPQHRTRVVALGTSLDLLSVLAGPGAAWLLATWTSHVAPWAVAPFAAGTVHLLTENAGAALAEELRVPVGDRGARDVSDQGRDGGRAALTLRA